MFEFIYNVVIVLLISISVHEIGHYIALTMLKMNFEFRFNWKGLIPTFAYNNSYWLHSIIVYLMGILSGLFVLLIMSKGIYLFINLFAYLLGCYIDFSGIINVIKKEVRK